MFLRVFLCYCLFRSAYFFSTGLVAWNRWFDLTWLIISRYSNCTRCKSVIIYTDLKRRKNRKLNICCDKIVRRIPDYYTAGYYNTRDIIAAHPVPQGPLPPDWYWSTTTSTAPMINSPRRLPRTRYWRFSVPLPLDTCHTVFRKNSEFCLFSRISADFNNYCSYTFITYNQ